MIERIGKLGLVVVVLSVLAGCSAKEEMSVPVQEHMEHEQMGAVPATGGDYKTQTLSSPEAKVGDKVICPVMNTRMEVKDNSLFVNYQDKKYYVCCNECVGDLNKNPEKYLKK